MQQLHIASTRGGQVQGVDLGGQIDQPGGRCQANHRSLHIQHIGGDQAGTALGDGTFGAQADIATASVVQGSDDQIGRGLGDRRGLGGGEHHVVGVAAAQGAGAVYLQAAIGAQGDAAVKRLGVGDSQARGVDNLDLAGACELGQLQGIRLSLQGDGALSQHTEHLRLDQARDHLHIIGGSRGVAGVKQPGLCDAARLGRQVNAVGRLQRGTVQRQVPAILAGAQAQAAGGGVQAGIAVGADAAVFGRTDARLQRDAAGIHRAAEVDIAV